MKRLLWLDDIRNPFKGGEWVDPFLNKYKEKGYQIVWVRNFNEFKTYIERNGFPDVVGFDHDLELDHYDFDPMELMSGKTNAVKEHGKTGMDAAKWLVEYVKENKLKFSEYFIQSANPVGKLNIRRYIEKYKENI